MEKQTGIESMMALCILLGIAACLPTTKPSKGPFICVLDVYVLQIRIFFLFQFSLLQ